MTLAAVDRYPHRAAVVRLPLRRKRRPRWTWGVCFALGVLVGWLL